MQDLMEAIVERCAGLDVHQATVVACQNVGAAGTRPRRGAACSGEDVARAVGAQAGAQLGADPRGVGDAAVQAALQQE